MQVDPDAEAAASAIASPHLDPRRTAVLEARYENHAVRRGLWTCLGALVLVAGLLLLGRHRGMSRSSVRVKIAALAGMLGPLLFVATFTMEGWLRPGYDARRTFISALSLGPRGWIQIVNFLFLGVTFFVLSRGVAVAFREGKASRAGHVLLAIIAVAFFASGPFMMDPMGTVREQMTMHGILHGIFGAFVFSLAPVTCFVFWRRFRSDESWRSLRTWTLVATIVITTAVVLLRIGTPRLAAPGNALTSWIGVIQRTALVTFLAWIFTFARALYRLPAN